MIDSETLIYPPIFGENITAFFTDKNPGADYQRIAEVCSMGADKLYLPSQKHTSDIQLLESDMSVKVADAVLTKRADVMIGVLVADCVPILIHAPEANMVAAVHAGWRGTASGLLKKTILKMLDHTSVEDMRIAIGPCICGRCYEVGQEVVSSLNETMGEGDYHQKKDGRHYIDLGRANELQAIAVGVPEDGIWKSGECTFCNPDRFYSYRYSNKNIIGGAGRQGGFISLTPRKGETTMLKAKEIMKKDVVTVTPGMSVRDLGLLFLDKNISACPVVDGVKNLCGIVSENDLISRSKRLHIPTMIHIWDAVIPLESAAVMEHDLKKMTGSRVADIMTEKVVTVTEDATMEDIATLMTEKRIHLIPVVDGMKILGIVGRQEILKSIFK